MECYFQTEVALSCDAVGCANDSSLKQKRACSSIQSRASSRSRASSQSRDVSPAASTTASTCGFLSEADDSSDCDDSLGQDGFCRTTMMMRNIPHEYSRTDLLDL